TDDNGRGSDFGPAHLDPGDYRIVFGTGASFAARAMDHFHPAVTIDFTVHAGQKHYHIPLLLSPSADSTHRGGRTAYRHQGKHAPCRIRSSTNRRSGPEPEAGGPRRSIGHGDRGAPLAPVRRRAIGARR